MRFYVDTPQIDIQRLSENNDFQISFDVKEDDFTAKLNIRLDPRSIEEDTNDGDDYFPRSFNRLIFSLSTEIDIDQTNFLEKAYFLVREYLGNFFDFVQVELGQYWVDIGPVRDWDLSTFVNRTSAKIVSEDKESDVLIPFGLNKKIRLLPKRRRYPEKSNGIDIRQTQDIQHWLEENKSPDLVTHLLANAKRLLLQGDYRSSSILAITALEEPLKRFVDERYAKKGIKPKPKPRFVGHYLNLFPNILEIDELTKWLSSWMESRNWSAYQINGIQVIDWATELNRKRSGTVHNKEKPAEFETLDKGIFAVEAIIEFVKEGNL